MTTCSQCGARMAPGVERCEYCGLLTEAGQQAEARARLEAEESRRREAREAQGRAEAQAQAQARFVAELERAAINAQNWGAWGLVLCCGALPAAVGLVKGAAVATRARSAGLPVPKAARNAQGLGFLGLMLGLAFWIFAGVQGHRDAERVRARTAALAQVLGDAPTRPTLEQATACRLAEAHVLAHGYDGHSGTYANAFECQGLVTQAGDRAALERFTFRPTSSGEAVDVWVCFARGARWYVDALRPEGCGLNQPQAPRSVPAQPAPARRRP